MPKIKPFYKDINLLAENLTNIRLKVKLSDFENTKISAYKI